MFTKFKGYTNIIAYIIFILITLLYVRVIFALYNAVQVTKDGGFVKSIDENNPIWYYRSEDNMILHDKILIGAFLFFLMSSLALIRKPKWALFLQVFWLVIACLEGYFIKSFIPPF